VKDGAFLVLVWCWPSLHLDDVCIMSERLWLLATSKLGDDAKLQDGPI